MGTALHQTTGRQSTLSTLTLIAGALLLSTAVVCEAQTVSVEGVGIDIRQVNQVYHAKSDHLDTQTWDSGLVFPRTSIPAEVEGMEFAIRDWRPAEQDSRTWDEIARVRADEARDVLIALPIPNAAGDGWTRLNEGASPDFHLDRATRSGPTFEPAPDAPYWFYTYRYNRPGRWVDLPETLDSTPRSPIVFAESGELKWINAPALMGNAVIIARKNPSPRSTTTANPNLRILSNGDYLAMSSNTTDGTALYKSTDKGQSWSLLANGFEVNRYSIFEHRGALYVLGKNTEGRGETRIYQSTDGGRNWRTQVFEGYGGGDAPSLVGITHGRIWKAAYSGNGPGFYSAPVDADLVQESSWTLTDGEYGEIMLDNGTGLRPGNEGTLLITENGTPYTFTKDDIFRPDSGWQDGITSQQPAPDDRTKLTYESGFAGPRLPYNGKSTAIYDPASDRYWALTSGHRNRTQLNLYSASSDGDRIGDFEHVATVLDASSSYYQGFNYPFIQIDGDDIVFVSRTAWDTERGRASRWHDANLFTFHRIENFRALESGNRIANPSFEDGFAGWYTGEGGDEGADYVEQNMAHSGEHRLTHWAGQPYEVYTYKDAVYLPNGTYTLTAWVRRSDGHDTCEMVAEDFGGEARTVEVPVDASWTKIEIPGIEVTHTAARIGFRSAAPGRAWATFDDVRLTRTGDQ